MSIIDQRVNPTRRTSNFVNSFQNTANAIMQANKEMKMILFIDELLFSCDQILKFDLTRVGEFMRSHVQFKYRSDERLVKEYCSNLYSHKGRKCHEYPPQLSESEKNAIARELQSVIDMAEKLDDLDESLDGFEMEDLVEYMKFIDKKNAHKLNLIFNLTPEQINKTQLIAA